IEIEVDKLPDSPLAIAQLVPYPGKVTSQAVKDFLHCDALNLHCTLLLGEFLQSQRNLYQHRQPSSPSASAATGSRPRARHFSHSVYGPARASPTLHTQSIFGTNCTPIL